MSNSPRIDSFKAQAVVQAMYPYTFGIVSDLNGEEGRGIGTGVGILWRRTYLIATAKHVIEDTAPDRIYYLLPQPSLQVRDSEAPVDLTRVRLRRRVTLQDPRIIHGDRDIAAILLPEQLDPANTIHFYGLDDAQRTPPLDTPVGFIGYPAAAARPLGVNFAVMPSHGFGAICPVTDDDDETSECGVTYAAGEELDPHGFSGSGIWFSASTGSVWSASLSLGGIVTSYRRRTQILIGYRVEVLTEFLTANL